MPKPRRDPAAAADSRPAFNRPPGTSPATEPQDPPKASKRSAKDKAKHSSAVSPEKKSSGLHTPRRTSRSPTKESPTRDRAQHNSSASLTVSESRASNALSVDSLAKLNAINDRASAADKEKERKEKEKEYKNARAIAKGQRGRKKKNRHVSDAVLEEGRANEKHAHVRKRSGAGSIREFVRRRGGDGGDEERSSSRRCWLILGVIALLLVIIIPVAVVVGGRNNKSASAATPTSTSSPSSPSANGVDPSSIPAAAKGTVLDPFTWLDTTDFNCTYTNETVGGLPVMGLNSTWDDTTRANPNVPPLNSNWTYGQVPIRGVNVGGWLSIEPFITPSLFNTYSASDNIVDEYTLSTRLGGSAAGVIEKHYATWVTEQTFIDIANAGMDHVRIPYPYWAVTTYDGDPYVPKIAWRYLLRGIEWARKQGLRVKLDLHSLPGSQNGWNHSGRLGLVGWLNGTDGTLNAQRALDIHNQLSKFFAQPRYDNVVTIYGLVNEPRMMSLPVQPVLDWNSEAIQIIRDNGMKQYIAFGDGFMGLASWDGIFKNVDPYLIMDSHQYVIFNTEQLAMTHQTKVNMACQGWTTLLTTANNPTTGWGPLFCGEWSQADTDCTPYLNNVNMGSRWAGTMNTGDPQTEILTQTCAAPPCSCDPANADPSQYSATYKQFLKMFAEAQMNTFEKVWGWFYWTWETESATQWSWKLGMEAGILPAKAYAPDFKCDSVVPTFSDLPENY